MERVEAARVLGVTTDATEVEIRRAFRALARQAHPDAIRSGAPSRELGELTEARDVLLGSDSGPTSDHDHAGDDTSPPSAAPPLVARASGQATRSGCLWGAIAALVAFAIAVVVLIFVLAAVFGGGGPGGSTPDADTDAGCIVVRSNDVDAVDCGTVGAQRVVSTWSGARTCPSGQNTLVSAATTWCVVPVQG